MLNTRKTLENGELYIVLEGMLNALTSPGFDEELEAMLPGVKKLTLDFKDLEYISSGGLRTILEAQQYMEDHSLPDVVVLNINENIRSTFELTGFDNFVEAHWAV